MWERLQQRWRTEKAGEGWLNPLYFAIGTRWLTWLIALGIVALGAAAEINLRFAGPLLLVTLVQLTGMHICLSTRVIPFLPRFLERNGWLSVLDIGGALGAVWLTGGWGSPFYEFALTSVIAPSLIFGLRGATAASLGFCLTYAVVLLTAGHGRDSFLHPDGRLEGAVVSCLVNPFLVAYFSALLAELMERLQQEQERVRQLAAQEERHRLAREMHDGVAQSLFMLALSLEACAEHARRGSTPKLADKLEGLVGVSRQALWDLRQSMYDLGPQDGTLRESLARLVREFGNVTSIPLDVSQEGEEGELPASVKTGLYRLVQESLANACKHSRASQVRLRVVYAEALEVEVLDDGAGFDPEVVARGNGLGNLATRARELGGQLTLSSRPGEGTKVAFTVPRRGSP